MAHDLAFVVPVYLDDFYAQKLIRRIRAIYPIAPLLVIADGVHDADTQELVESCGGTYYLGDRLKPQTFGCAWTIRMLELMQQYLEGDIWVKLDADSMLYREIDLAGITSDFDLAGAIYNNGHFDYTRGGCRIYNPLAAEKILRSGLLSDYKYVWEQRFGYLRYCNRMKLPGDPPGEVFEAIHSEDFCLGDVGKQLGLKLVEVPDLCVMFRESVPDNSDLRYSVVHPVR